MEDRLEDLVREIEKAISLLESGEVSEVFLGFGKDFYIEVDRETALEILKNRLEKLRLTLRRGRSV